MTKKFCALLLFLTLYCVIQAQDGWNNTTKAWLLTSSRNYFLQSAKNNKKDPIVSKAENREQMAICITNKIIESYTYSEYVALENDELTNFVHEKTHDCLQETGIKALYYDKYREDAERLGDKGKYGDVIEIYLSIDENGQADLIDYSNLGRMYVLDKQYSKAITYLLKGESLDNADLYIQAYLAHAYLLSGDFEKAVFIYKKYKGQNVDWGYDKKIWEEFIEDNFNSFKKEHIQCTRCDEIINLFKNTSTSYNSLPTTSNYDAQIEFIAEELAKQFKNSEGYNVGVLDFRNNDGNVSQLCELITEDLSAELAMYSNKRQKYTVIERNNLKILLEENNIK